MSERVINNAGDMHHVESEVRKLLDEIKHKAFTAGL